SAPRETTAAVTGSGLTSAVAAPLPTCYSLRYGSQQTVIGGGVGVASLTRFDEGTALRPSPERPGRPSLAVLVARLVQRTPERLVVLLLAVVVLALTTGATCWANVHGRQAVLADVNENSQLSVAALDIYQSLSDADTTTASAFLVYGSEPTEQRKRYRDD